jgi:enolase
VSGTIFEAVKGREFDQLSLDAFLGELDGTANKSRLGANAILGTSLAFARAATEEEGKPLYAYIGALDGRTSFALPEPLFNILNGGKHASGGIDIQETMIAPVGLPSMREKVEAASGCVAALKMFLEEKGLATVMGDEGGFAPALSSNDEALELLVAAIRRAGYSTEVIKIALDVAATSFHTEEGYVLHAGTKRQLAREEMLAWYEHLSATYPIISIEDGFAEDDWNGFSAITGALGTKLSIVGDDLTVTNVGRIEEAVEKHAANACIIKPNQIGTLSEAVKAVQTARAAGWKVFASHRSGETLDTFIADFAVGLSCDYLKAGAPTREERMVKYTRLMEIEDAL